MRFTALKANEIQLDHLLKSTLAGRVGGAYSIKKWRCITSFPSITFQFHPLSVSLKVMNDWQTKEECAWCI